MVKILATGIDSLNIGFNISKWLIDDKAFKQLNEGKRSAGEKLFGGNGVTVELGDREFIILAKGTKGYEYVMYNDDIRLDMAKNCQSGRVYPEAFVQLNSGYLWGKGYNNAVSELVKWLSTIATINGEKVNRADLCVDLATDLPDLDLKQGVVTRARNKVDYHEIEHYTQGKRDTGYRFGSGSVMARIYDKKYEIKHSDKSWFREIWKQGGWNTTSGVTRAEFQLRRPFLKEYDIDTYDKLIYSIPDMWRTLTGEWLVIKKPNAKDTNHRRWQTSELWQTVQSATSLFGQCIGIQRYKQKQAKIEPLTAQMKGIMISVVAIDSTIRGEYFATSRLKADINQYLDSDEFKSQVYNRRGRYSNLLSANSGKTTPRI
jgi:hypothetical protein